MTLNELFIKTCKLELEYLNNPNQNTAKEYNTYKNKLCKNKNFYKLMLKVNIKGI